MKSKTYLSAQAWMFILLALAFIWIAATAGCSTETISHVEPMVYCDDGLADSLLKDPCDTSKPLADDALFQDSLDKNRTTDLALDACALKTQKLQEALVNCHKLTTQHNQVIQSLNKQ